MNESKCSAFLWQNGVMTDLNTLIPANSPLSLLQARTINSRGETVGFALEASTGEIHAYLATPCDKEHADKEGCMNDAEVTPAAQGDANEGLKPILPENVRKLLKQQRAHRDHIHGFRSGPVE